MATLMPSEGQSQRPLPLRPRTEAPDREGRQARTCEEGELSQSNIGGLSLQRPGRKTRPLLVRNCGTPSISCGPHLESHSNGAQPHQQRSAPNVHQYILR